MKTKSDSLFNPVKLRQKAMSVFTIAERLQKCRLDFLRRDYIAGLSHAFFVMPE